MKQSMSEQFELFLSQLSETNATLDYFTDKDNRKRNTIMKSF
jgi:type II restriction enzyme